MKIKLSNPFAVAFATAAMFVACTRSNTNDTSSPLSAPDPATFGVPAEGARLVSQLVEEVLDRNGNAASGYTTFFTYDPQGRLVRAQRRPNTYPDMEPPARASHEDLTLEYYDYHLIITNHIAYGDTRYTLVDYTGTFSATGHLVDGDYSFTSVGPNGDGKYSMQWTGSYDADDRMTRCGWDDSHNDIAWSGGSMTSITPTDEKAAVNTFEYSTFANSSLCNFDLNYVGGNTGFVGLYVALPGMLGRRSAHLRSVQTVTPADPVLAPDTYAFGYQTDTQGFITGITQLHESVAGPQTTQYTITYR